MAVAVVAIGSALLCLAMRVRTEACVASLAEVHGLMGVCDGFELCTWLECGGVTPSLGLIRSAFERTGSPVRVLVRPTPGSFQYDEHARNVLLHDVGVLCQESAVAGVVTGALDRHAMPDTGLMREVVARSNGREVTFHRAIDHSADPVRALHACIGVGVHRVLTSAGGARAIDAWPILRAMVQAAGAELLVAAGGGVAPDHVVELVERTGVREVHFSARRPAAPAAVHSMGRASLSSSAINGPLDMIPDAAKVQAIATALVNAGLR